MTIVHRPAVLPGTRTDFKIDCVKPTCCCSQHEDNTNVGLAKFRFPYEMREYSFKSQAAAVCVGLRRQAVGLGMDCVI